MPDKPDDRARQLEETNRTLETRLRDLEKQLISERERALSAEVRSKDEQATTANVESAIKDAQEKLRREKREQELDTARQAAETKARDLERRLAEERDMWVTMLKEHMSRGGDNKPLLQEISALKSELAAKETAIASLKEQSTKGGGDQKILQKEITALKDMLTLKESAVSAAADEARQAREALVSRENDLKRQEKDFSLRMETLNQTLAEREAEMGELRRQADSSRGELERVRKESEGAVKSAAGALQADWERERAIFQKRMKEQKEFLDKLSLHAEELEKNMGQRDALIQGVRTENEELRKKMEEMSAAKDAEARLMRENLQRLGQQNKELLTKLREAADDAEKSSPRGSLPPEPHMQEMLSSLEDALSNRDKMLEDQQKSIEEKRGLIEGLFTDLRSLDEQAVALLDERNRNSQEMKERVSALTTENERLRRLLEARVAEAEASAAAETSAPAPQAAPAAEEPPAAAPEPPAET